MLMRLLTDRGGNFGLMTGLLCIPLIYGMGSAVDIYSAYTERTNMQEIADAAALVGGRTYDGTNSATAITQTQNFLKGNAGKLPAGATYQVTMSGANLNVAINATTTSNFMQVAGIGGMDIAAGSQSVTPMKPKTVIFTPTTIQGWYYKKVSIIVVRPNSTVEEVVGTVTYQPTTHNNGGQGNKTVSPSGTLDLGKYSKLILQMEVKNDGCAIGYKATISGASVTCSKNSGAAYSKYDLTLRTDNPDTSYYLFVEGVQLAKGVTSPLDSILACGKTSNHAWEDGGGWDRQDFFYTVAVTCAPDGEFVRLTK